MRNSHQVVPSFFSLLYKSIEFRWGVKQIPKDVLEHYNQRRYKSMIALYHYFYELQKNEVLSDRIIVIRYEDLITDLKVTFNTITEFTGMTVSKELRENVPQIAAAQNDYKRKHSHIVLEKFGSNRSLPHFLEIKPLLTLRAGRRVSLPKNAVNTSM